MPTPEELTALLRQFQATLTQWPHDSGLFFELMQKKIEAMQSQFVQAVAAQLPAQTFSKNTDAIQTATDQTDVYVELYQSDGDNMARWAMILKAIAVQAISRPIYQNEADVCSMIRAKQQPSKEGYAVVTVLNADIMTPVMPYKDSAGRPLVQIKSGVLKSENIIRFVHITGQYAWQSDRLIKLDLPSPIRVKG